MFMQIYFFGCIFYWANLSRAENLCYKCTSEHIIVNWGSYLPILSDMDSTATKRCLNDSASSSIDIVVCKSPCFILNVTGFSKEKLITYGVLRGCQNTFWSKASKLDDRKRNCSSKIGFIHNNGRKREFHAEYCFCNGDHCNGVQPNGGYSLRKALFFTRRSCSEISNPLLFVILFLLLFIFSIKL